jgi:ELWxxDGT repeat protein
VFCNMELRVMAHMRRFLLVYLLNLCVIATLVLPVGLGHVAAATPQPTPTPTAGTGSAATSAPPVAPTRPAQEHKTAPSQAITLVEPTTSSAAAARNNAAGRFAVQVKGPNTTLPSASRPNQSELTASAVEPGSIKTILVNTTSLVIDGDTSSVDNLLARPERDNDDTNPDDNHHISLPEAFHAVNRTGPGYTIKLDLPGGSVIKLFATQKLEVGSTVIDGDRNDDNKPDVQIDIPEQVVSLQVLSSNNIIRGLVIQALVLEGANAHSNLVVDNYMGTNLAGEQSLGKESAGVLIKNGAHSNVVENNLIAGNAGSNNNHPSMGVGIWAGAHSNVLRGNRIGVNAQGLALPNEHNVVIGNAPILTGGDAYGPVTNNVVGGPRTGADCHDPCNQIVGSKQHGIWIHGTKAISNVVAGNYIGLYQHPAASLTQVIAIANLGSGVVISGGAQQNVVGGSHDPQDCDRACNYIAGNSERGVQIDGADTSNNAVQGNVIGLKPDQTIPAFKQIMGVSIQNGAHHNIVGGKNSAKGCLDTCNVIAGNKAGIGLVNAHHNQVNGNLVGLDLYGKEARSNELSGVQISHGATNNTIGSLPNEARCDGPCNILSGNTEAGVVLSHAGTSNNTVNGNFIGARFNGTLPVAEGNYVGVALQQGASLNTVGGNRSDVTCTDPCNVISGNEVGVLLNESGTNDNTVLGNYIGLSPTGNALPNFRVGVQLQSGASNNTIGGVRTSSACTGPCNVISGNDWTGVEIIGAQTKENVVIGNNIGSDRQGTKALPNEGYGIFLLDGTSDNYIGGPWTPSTSAVTCQGPCNLVTGNKLGGVRVGRVNDTAAKANLIRGNLIYSNTTELNIDLRGDGPSANDADDSDVGPNDLLNTPSQVMLNYNAATNQSIITGRVRATTGAVAVDLYGTDEFNASGAGEAKHYLGSVTPDASGLFTHTFQDVPPFNLVSATFTDANGSTSEMSGLDIWATGLEVVQSIQDAKNSVPLDAGERTVARLHVRSNDRTMLNWARIRAERNGALLGQQRATDVGTWIEATTHPSRNERTHSFYFVLPPEWTTPGTTKLQAEFNLKAPHQDDPGDSDVLNNTIETSVAFSQPGTLRVTLFTASYPFSTTTLSTRTLSPTPAEINKIKQTLRRMLPGKIVFDEVELPINAPLGQQSVLLSAPSDRYIWVIDYLRTMRNAMTGVPSNDYWLAVVPTAPTDPQPTETVRVVGGRGGHLPTPIGATSPNPLVAAHELGHMLGRDHVACSGDEVGGTDSNYPHPRGIIGGPPNDEKRDVGLFMDDTLTDPLFQIDIKPSTHGDIMSYCDTKWISRYTYENIARKLSPPSSTALTQAALSSSPVQVATVAGNFLAVHATINTATQQGILVRLTRAGQVDTLPPRVAGPYRIRLFDQTNRVLAEYPFTPKRDVEVANRANVYEVVNFVAGTRRVAIYSDAAAREVLSAPISANAPTVTITGRTGGSTLPLTGTINLTWQGSDVDGDALKYSVYYSHDGAVWSVVAGETPSTTLTIDVVRLRGSNRAAVGRFRIVAHDGVLTGLVTSSLFTVPAKAPQISIVSPVAGSSVGAQQSVVLEASAFDREDGQLGDAQIRWASNLDGSLGTGATRSNKLSVGTHTLSVSATDSNNQVFTATTTITVKEDERDAALRLGQEVVERTNAERAANNLPPLKLNPNLQQSSQWMAADMLAHNYYTHTDRLGRNADTRIRQFGYAPSEGTAENLNRGTGIITPTRTISDWMNSSGHRANILHTSMREIGVGYAAAPDGSKSYWVQNFGFRSDVYPVVINREAARTTSANVSLYIYGTGWAQQMRFSNDGTTWSNWEAYSSTKNWTLASGTGTRTVYVELQNGTTVLRANDSIELVSSTTPPAPTTPTVPTTTTTVPTTVPTTTTTVPTTTVPTTTTTVPTSTTTLPLPTPGQPGNAWAWGLNDGGQLGDGKVGTTYTRASVGRTTGLTNTTAIDGGEAFGVALLQNGTVSTWGANQQGQLGDGTTTNRATPAQVAGLSNVVAVEAGASHVLALKSDGTVWSWGANAHGQLGNNSTTNRSTPAQITALTNIVAIAAGDAHSLALRNDGTVWAWGRNERFELGVSPNTNRLQPVQVPGVTNARALTAGSWHSLALLANGTVMAWGSNQFGQLGISTTSGSDALPQAVSSSLTDIVQLAAGGLHSLARKSDGSVWAWGYNLEGQVGATTPVCIRSTSTGDIPCARTPVQVTGLSNTRSIAAGGRASYAVGSDGTAWAWGLNGQGQLGDGTFIYRAVPTRVEELASVAAIGAGARHAYAISAQATLPTPTPDTLPAPGTPPAPVVVNGSAPWQVRDIVTGTLSSAHSDPGPVVAVGSVSYFAAATNGGGRELWRTDGTITNTRLVADINPAGSSNPQQLTRSGSVLYFTANDGSNGAELWRTDGTTGGTRLLKDIFGGEPTLPYTVDSGPVELTDVNGTLYFVANDGWRFDPSLTAEQNWELWKTDGTVTGTVRVKDLARHMQSTVGSVPRELTQVGTKLFFTARDLNFPDATHSSYWSHGRELWVSDGTDAGTVLVKDIVLGEGDSNPTQLVNLNGTLYFAAGGLWKSNGTAAGTVPVKPGADMSDLQQLTVVGNTLFFTARDSAGGRELWKSDGTATGTVRVKDITAGTGDTVFGQLTTISTTLFFNAKDASGSELWKSDGTATGTVRVKDIAPGTASSDPICLVNVGGTAYFAATQGSGQPRQLWKSNGTDAGTVLVKAVTPVSIPQNPGECLSNGNNTLYFAADDGTSGRELWRSNGTDAGTVRVANINAPAKGAAGSAVAMGTVNNTLLFRANDGVSGDELWASNGTVTGTVRLKDIASGAASANPSELFTNGQWAYFAASDASNGNELWRTDGTAAGTQLIKNINPKESDSNPASFTRVTTTTFFVATSSNSGRELWQTDGTAFGTRLVKDIAPGTDWSQPRGLVNRNGVLFFLVTTPSGDALYKSDGTAAGTVQVATIATGSIAERPQELVNANGTLYFFANGYVLYKSDGTTAGTVLVADLRSQYNVARPKQLRVVGSRLFFVMNNRDLWVSDGTQAGTLAVTGFGDREGGTIGETVVTGDRLLFTANNTGGTNAGGWELWTSDGTQTGSRQLHDINPGASGSRPQGLNFLPTAGVALFGASDGATGTEPWRSNGTAAGTVRVADIAGGAVGSNPRGFTLVGQAVFFWATGGAGEELWALPLSMLTSTTTTPSDTTKPTVTGHSPSSGATNVLVGSNITATFSEGVTGVSTSNFTLKQGTTTIAAAVSYDAATRKATLNPSADLGRNKVYTVTLTSGIKDGAGNTLNSVSWTFTTQP